MRREVVFCTESDWIEAQKRLTNGRICPICKKICFSQFEGHLKTHNLTKLDYIFLRDNITGVPKCSNPKCNNKVELTDGGKHYKFNRYCCHSCSLTHRNQLGLNPFSLRDENGLSVSKRMVLAGTNTFVKKDYAGRSYQKQRVLEGTHNFAVRDEFGRSYQQKRVEEGTHNFLYNGDPEHDKEVYNRSIQNGLNRSRSSIWGYQSYLTFKDGTTKTMRSSWEPWLAIWLDIQGIPFEWEAVKLYSDRYDHTYCPDCHRLDTNELLEVKGYDEDYDKEHIRELALKAGYKALVMFYKEDINRIYEELRDKYHLDVESHKKNIFSRSSPSLSYFQLINNSSGY